MSVNSEPEVWRLTDAARRFVDAMYHDRRDEADIIAGLLDVISILEDEFLALESSQCGDPRVSGGDGPRAR
jgi:hypothetical protein